MHTVFQLPIPYLPVTVSAGFPSPAAAYAAKPLVLDDWLWPKRASCQLVAGGNDGRSDGRSYLLLDQSLSPIVGDRLWMGEGEPLLWWTGKSEEFGSGAGTGIVEAASIQLFRRRPDPSCRPDSVHNWLVRRPFATYLVTAEGRSMTSFEIHNGSLLVVDRSCDLHDGDIVIAGCAEGFLVKQYRSEPARLVAGNAEYPDIVLERAPQYDLDGVVIASLTRHRG